MSGTTFPCKHSCYVILMYKAVTNTDNGNMSSTVLSQRCRGIIFGDEEDCGPQFEENWHTKSGMFIWIELLINACIMLISHYI